MTPPSARAGAAEGQPSGSKAGERPGAARLVLLAGLASLGALATNIMLPAFPAMASELGVTPRELTWTLSSFFVTFAVGQLFVGPLADAVGRRPFVLGGLAVFVVGSGICAFAVSLPFLVAGRVVQALGACAASVLARTIARDLYRGAELTRALALVMIAMAAAPGFSPALGTAVTLGFGWRATFVLAALAAFVVAYCYRTTINETLSPALRRSAHPRVVAVSYLGLVRNPRFVLPTFTVSLVIGCLYTFFGAAPAILMTGFGLSGAGLSLFFAATVFVVFGSGLLTARLARRWGAPRMVLGGLAIALAGAAWLFVQANSTEVATFMAAVTVFLAGIGLVNPVVTAIALEPFGDRAGTASALLGCLQMTCAAAGTALVGALPLAPDRAFGWVVFGGMLLASILFVGFTGLVTDTPHQADDHSATA